MPLLSRLFSVATFFNAGSAVVAGMAGHLAVEVIPHTSHNKFASAFDVGVIVLLISSALAAFRWAERFGGDGSSSGAAESLCASIKTIRHSRALIYLGLVRRHAEMMRRARMRHPLARLHAHASLCVLVTPTKRRIFSAKIFKPQACGSSNEHEPSSLIQSR